MSDTAAPQRITDHGRAVGMKGAVSFWSNAPNKGRGSMHPYSCLNGVAYIVIHVASRFERWGTSSRRTEFNPLHLVNSNVPL